MSEVIECLFAGCVIAVLLFYFCVPSGFVSLPESRNRTNECYSQIGLAYLIIFFVTFVVVQHYSDKAYNEVVEIDKSGEVSRSALSYVSQMSISFQLATEIFDNVSTIQQLAVEGHFQQRFDEIQMRRRKPLATVRFLLFVNSNKGFFRRFAVCQSFTQLMNRSTCYWISWLQVRSLFSTFQIREMFQPSESTSSTLVSSMSSRCMLRRLELI